MIKDIASLSGYIKLLVKFECFFSTQLCFNLKLDSRKESRCIRFIIYIGNN